MTNQNEAQIVARIEELKGDLAHNFGQICDLLVQVKNHYLHRDSIFRWYREVSSGKLLPEVVMAFGTRRTHLNHISGYNRDLQKTLARGGEFDWATIERGEVVEKRTSWHKMPTDAFKRMFPIGGPVRTVAEQRAILEAELAAAPKVFVNRQPVVRVDADTRTMRVAGHTVPLNVILGALREANIIGPEAALENHLTTFEDVVAQRHASL